MRQWFAGDTENIKNENLVAIAEGYDTTVDWLLSGTGAPPRRPYGLSGRPNLEIEPTTAAGLVRELLAKGADSFSAAARQHLLNAVEALDDSATIIDRFRTGQVGDEVSIAHYDIPVGLGPTPPLNDYPQTLQAAGISPRHLCEMGVEFLDHLNLKLLTGWGQSMAPTIKHRDPLLIDVSINAFTGDGIYLFAHQDLLYIKRLQKKGREHFKMISDNGYHPAEDIRVDDTFIQARVLLVCSAHLI